MVCTLPKFLPIYKRYERKFSDLCHAHDNAYMLRYKSKWEADMELARGIWQRGNRTIAVATWFFCSTVGWWYWLRD